MIESRLVRIKALSSENTYSALCVLCEADSLLLYFHKDTVAVKCTVLKNTPVCWCKENADFFFDATTEIGTNSVCDRLQFSTEKSDIGIVLSFVLCKLNTGSFLGLHASLWFSLTGNERKLKGIVPTMGWHRHEQTL